MPIHSCLQVQSVLVSKRGCGTIYLVSSLSPGSWINSPRKWLLAMVGLGGQPHKRDHLMDMQCGGWWLGRVCPSSGLLIFPWAFVLSTPRRWMVVCRRRERNTYKPLYKHLIRPAKDPQKPTPPPPTPARFLYMGNPLMLHLWTQKIRTQDEVRKVVWRGFIGGHHYVINSCYISSSALLCLSIGHRIEW